MSLDVGTLVGYLKIDDQQFKAGLQKGERSLKKLGSSVAATVRLISAAWIATKVVPILKDLATSASDLAETQSKVNVVLGDGAAAVSTWANTADASLGVSKKAALDAAAAFAVFGKGAGLTGDDLVKFSVGLTTLASDLASFWNTSPEDAALALGAALRGENEPIRAYGVLLDEATIKAKALSMGLLKSSVDMTKVRAAQLAIADGQRKYNDAVKKFGPQSLEAQKAQLAISRGQDALAKATAGATDDMTQQQRVLAVQAAIYDQTKDAQGDFARTSDGAANQQRILKAEVENVKAAIGEALLPTMKDLISVLRATVGYIKENHQWLVPLVGILAGFGGTVYLVVQAIRAWTMVQWALNIALGMNPIGLVIIAIALLVAGIMILWNNSAGFRDFFIGLWGHIWSFLKMIGAWFAGPFVDFFATALHWILQTFLDVSHWITEKFLWLVGLPARSGKMILDGAKHMWDGLASSLKSVINLLIRLWNAIDFGINISVPDWVPGIGGKGFKVDDIVPDIPYLKDGGVIKATPGGRPVVMGDGGEVEIASPVSLMRQVVRQEIGRTAAGNGTVRFILDGTGLLRGLRRVGRVQGGNPKTVFVGA